MNNYSNASEILRAGGVVAYPTEAVFGLGCDPFNKKAVYKILALKNRSSEKGLILIAASWDQLEHLTLPIEQNKLQKVLATWPGPYTWIFPASNLVPKWITGKHNNVALRVTAHPIAKKICENFQGPIVSTSANLEGKSPAKTAEEVAQQFPQGIDFVVPGKVGDLAKPTVIMDTETGKIIR